MSNTIRLELALLLGATLLLTACDRPASRNQADPAVKIEGSSNEQAANTVAETKASPPAQASAAPEDAKLPKEVLEAKDIIVNGEPACALTVRYAEELEQPVTWRGESCGQIDVRLSSVEDLKRIGQISKLDDEMLSDLAGMPGQRALYIEGEHSSAIYPLNVMRRIYEVPLAD